MSFLDTLVNNASNSLSRYDEAKIYLKNRQVSEDEIKAYKLGFAKILTIKDDGSEDYQIFMNDTYGGRAFENKIIFPIYDYIGRVIGLFGRSIESKAFKYYLTLEAKHIGVLGGLYQALPYIYETKKVYIVEGPFDLLAFQKAFKNTVAAMTAGLSDIQYEILSFFADEIITVFDYDPADPERHLPEGGQGQFATEQAKKKWKNVSSVTLGTYKDPDECLKVMGRDKFVKFVRDKVNQKIFFC